MNKTRFTMIAAGLALLALPALAAASDGAGAAVAITDPALLESMGFAPDERNVYATPQALREMAMSPSERAAQEKALAAEESSPAGGPYGASAGYSTVSYQEFRPLRSTAANPAEFNNFGSALYCIAGPAFYDAQIESLPHGAVFDRVRFWFYDTTDTDNIHAILFRVCQPDSAPGDPVVTTLGTTTTEAAPGNVSISIGSVNIDTIDNTSCSYTLRVRFDSDLFASCSEGDDLRIQKARARWRRQISPAPGTATFNDVPTSHPFFQQIEALAASGITSGCGDGSGYCPGATLTRAQMAAFLSTALGLHWETITQP